MSPVSAEDLSQAALKLFSGGEPTDGWQKHSFLEVLEEAGVGKRDKFANFYDLVAGKKVKVSIASFTHEHGAKEPTPRLGLGTELQFTRGADVNVDFSSVNAFLKLVLRFFSEINYCFDRIKTAKELAEKNRGVEYFYFTEPGFFIWTLNLMYKIINKAEEPKGALDKLKIRKLPRESVPPPAASSPAESLPSPPSSPPAAPASKKRKQSPTAASSSDSEAAIRDSHRTELKRWIESVASSARTSQRKSCDAVDHDAEKRFVTAHIAAHFVDMADFARHKLEAYYKIGEGDQAIKGKVDLVVARYCGDSTLDVHLIESKKNDGGENMHSANGQLDERKFAIEELGSGFLRIQMGICPEVNLRVRYAVAFGKKPKALNVKQLRKKGFAVYHVADDGGVVEA